MSHPAVQAHANVGVILTVGGLCGSDRVAMVMPLVTDDGGLDAITRCEDAVAAFRVSEIVTLLNCISSDAQITYLAAEGMCDGMIPFREDFALATYPGSRPAGVMPSSVTSLVAFYADPADLGAGVRMRTAKSFIWGVPQGDVVGDQIQGALLAGLINFGIAMQTGWATQLGGGKWYRQLAAPSTRLPGDPVIRIATSQPRAYIATQRRRLLPHL